MTFLNVNEIPTNQNTQIYLKTTLINYTIMTLFIFTHCALFQYQCILYEETSRSRFHGNNSSAELSERVLSWRGMVEPCVAMF